MKCSYCGANAVLTQRLGTVEARTSSDEQTSDVAEVVRLLRAGRTVEAIQVYRERFGMGQREAETAVERIAAGQAAGTLLTSSIRRGLIGFGAVMLLVVGVAGMLVARGTRERAPEAGSVAEPAAPWASLVPDDERDDSAFAEEVLRFGSEGTGAGRFDDARSVAVDGSGRLYVAEYSSGRVQVFDSLGTFLTQWLADPEMPLPALAADRDGVVYVLQSGRIQRYEGATGEALPALPYPRRADSYTDFTLALDGSLWAVAFPHSLVHLNRDGGVTRTIDMREAIDDDVLPDQVAVSGTGDVYVSDRRSGQIYRLDPGGRFVDRFGGAGEGPGTLRSPSDLAVDGRGRLYVSDLGSGINVFDADGRFLGAFGGSSVIFGLAFNDRDDLFAAYRNDHQVAKFRLPR